MKDQLLSWNKPRRAYVSPLDSHQLMLEAVMNQYVSGYLVAGLRQNTVTNYTDFVEEFVKFSDVPLSRGVITLSRFVKSIFCTNMCSGLMVEVYEGRHDNS